jgi:hypothetical protein
MLTNSLKILAALALATLIAHPAAASPHWTGGSAPGIQPAGRIAQSPVPPQFHGDPMLLLVRDVRQAGGGGGCWSHCFNTYNECVGLNEKNLCVARVKTCMETCDRLSGLANPTQREQPR